MDTKPSLEIMKQIIWKFIQALTNSDFEIPKNPRLSEISDFFFAPKLPPGKILSR